MNHALLLAACPIIAASATIVLNGLSLIQWRRKAGEHWSERARFLQPAREGAIYNLWLLPCNLAGLHSLLYPAGVARFLAVLILAFSGSLLGTFFFDRKIFPESTFRSWGQETLAALAQRFIKWGILLATMILMPAAWDHTAGLVVVWYLLVQILLAWQGGLWLGLKLKVLEPAPDWLLELVNTTARPGSLPPEKILLVKSTLANAFALPATGHILFTSKIIQVLGREELRAVCLHELAHLAESRATIAWRFAGILAELPWIFFIPISAQSSVFVAVVAGFYSSLIIRYFLKILQRRFETQADRQAVGQVADPAIYARALERLHEVNQIPAVLLGKNHSHPNLYDRLTSLGLAPSYPRPKPPPRFTFPGLVSLVMFVVLFPTSLLPLLESILK